SKVDGHSVGPHQPAPSVATGAEAGVEPPVVSDAGSVVGGARAAASAANTASSIALAMGPATRPPVPAEISSLVPLSITTTAYFGASAGANAVIHRCEACGSPAALSWAVPVLAATGMPPARAMQQLAVPRRATPTIRSVMMAAVPGVIG